MKEVVHVFVCSCASALVSFYFSSFRCLSFQSTTENSFNFRKNAEETHSIGIEQVDNWNQVKRKAGSFLLVCHHMLVHACTSFCMLLLLSSYTSVVPMFISRCFHNTQIHMHSYTHTHKNSTQPIWLSNA